MTTTAQIIDQHRQTSRGVGYGVTVHCACGTEHWAHVSGDQPMTDENNSHRNADRQHAQHVADALRAAQPRPLTARERLDAAWEAAHVPTDGIIPKGAEYVERYGDGSFYGPLTSGGGLRADRGVLERRLLDPPSRSEGAEELEAVLRDEWSFSDEDAFADLAERLASRGVRVVSEDDGGDETPDRCPHIGGPGGDCGCPL